PAKRGGEEAGYVPEPGAQGGRPRLAPLADAPAAAREGRAHRRGCAARPGARDRRGDRLEPRRPASGRRDRRTRRARRGARRAAGGDRPDGRWHSHRCGRAEGEGARRRRGVARTAVRLRARRRRAARRGGADREPGGRDRPRPGAGRRPLARRARPLMADQGVVLAAPGEVALEEIDVAEPGPGEVLVRIEATGVCHSDLHVIENDGWGSRLPVLLGHEGAGVVEAVGEGVALEPGDRVVLGWKSNCGGCTSCGRGVPRECTRPPAAPGRLHRANGEELTPVLRLGTFATRTVVPEASVVKYPDELPAEQA